MDVRRTQLKIKPSQPWPTLSLPPLPRTKINPTLPTNTQKSSPVPYECRNTERSRSASLAASHGRSIIVAAAHHPEKITSPTSHLPFPSPNSSNHQLASAKVLPYASAANHCGKNWRVGAVLPKFACIHFPNQLEELRFFKQHPAIHSYEVVTPTTLSTTPHP